MCECVRVCVNSAVHVFVCVHVCACVSVCVRVCMCVRASQNASGEGVKDAPREDLLLWLLLSCQPLAPAHARFLTATQSHSHAQVTLTLTLNPNPNPSPNAKREP